MVGEEILKKLNKEIRESRIYMNHIQLNNVELQIVQFLFEHEKQFVPSKEIAQKADVSDKTIRKYIKSLNNLLKDFGASIEMKRGSGYQLVIQESSLFYRLLEHIETQKTSFEDSVLLSDNADRERFVLNAIFLENQLVTIDDLADLMFVSKSTVSTVIQHIKTRIKRFELKLTYDSEGQIVIEGEEIEKRRFILNYFFASSSLDNMVNVDLFESNEQGFSVETIFIIVLEKCREFEIQLSDFVLQNLVLHIALAIKRNEKGFVINHVQVDDNIEFSKELFVAEKIVASIESLIDIQFTENEAKYIALHLKSKANNQELAIGPKEEAEQSLQTQITDALEKMQRESDIHFSMDHQLIMGLKIHFEPLLTRLKLDIQLKNPLIEEISEKYSDVLKATQTYFSRMPILSEFDVSTHEWAYISLHILAAIERFKQDNKVNVIVICATGLGSAQMLKNRLENEFAANINIVDVISYYQLKDDMLQNVNLIVSTIDMSASFYNIPVVKVSVFLNKQDIDILNRHINHVALSKDETTSDQGVTDKIHKLFHKYFAKERFVIFEQAVSREEAVRTLMETLTDMDHSTFYQDLQKQIRIREQFGSLVFTEQVAFPHPAQPVGLNSEIAVGILPEELAWDQEHKQVRIIVLMSPSKIENKGLDVINSGLAEFIVREDKLKKAMEITSFSEFEQLFLETVTE